MKICHKVPLGKPPLKLTPQPFGRKRGVSTLVRMIWGTFVEKNFPSSNGHIPSKRAIAIWAMPEWLRRQFYGGFPPSNSPDSICYLRGGGSHLRSWGERDIFEVDTLAAADDQRKLRNVVLFTYCWWLGLEKTTFTQRCKKRQIWQLYLCYSFQGGANF